MLTASSTRLAAGVTIFGTRDDLERLYDTITAIEERSGVPESIGDFLLGLCYDVRHAFEGRRERSKETRDPGFKVLWPILLLQLGILRSLASGQTLAAEERAILDQLQAAVEAALLEQDPFAGAECVEWLHEFGGVSPRYLIAFGPHMTYEYLFETRAGKARFQNLPTILWSLDESSLPYRRFRKELEKAAAKAGCDPSQLEDTLEWPAIKW